MDELRDPDDVTDRDIILVERRRLIEQLAQHGLTQILLERMSAKLLRENKGSRSVRWPSVAHVRSRQYGEHR